ncbi:MULTISPECIES: hypothetical protein [Actinomycetes]|uniref:hypothetical protein n=1 Tax=Actinomycetes TaxID=1760 RepID=UPI0002FAA13A|nr:MULTISPECIES: hypothetical protein [Actinomycetes]
MADERIDSMPMVDGETGVEHRIAHTKFVEHRAGGIYPALCGETVRPGVDGETAVCAACDAIWRGVPPQPAIPRPRRSRRGHGRHRREDMAGPWVRLERV